MALFERHDAKNQKIKALQTHGTRNAPEVWIELDIGGERVSVHKRFIENRFAEVRLHREGTVAHGAEAEELCWRGSRGGALAGQGHAERHGGVGLLWVAQDETAYADPGDALDDSVRGTLSRPSAGRSARCWAASTASACAPACSSTPPGTSHPRPTPCLETTGPPGRS